MEQEQERLSLINLSAGVAIEKFDDELQRVLDNITDPNTIEDAAREITLKVKITPNNDREIGKVEIDCFPKLAKNKPYATQIVIGKDGRGLAVALEYNPQQARLKFDQWKKTKTEADNVTQLHDERSEQP